MAGAAGVSAPVWASSHPHNTAYRCENPRWVRTELMCRPYDKGGLGIRSLNDMMLAYQGKLAWEFLSQRSLWARFAKSRFSIGKPGSPIWNAIDHIITYLRNQSVWEIGDGSILIDKLCWHHDIPCLSDLRGLTAKEVLERPTQRAAFLGALPYFTAEHYKDAPLDNSLVALKWTSHTSGNFSIKEFIDSYSTKHPILSWAKVIWQAWISPKVSLFMWRLFMRGLPIDSNIRRIGISLTSRCVCCLQHEEQVNHLFFQGPWAKEVWNLLSPALSCLKPMSTNSFILYWLKPFQKRDFVHCLRVGLACYSLWEIWRERNNILHGGTRNNLTAKLFHWARVLVTLIPGYNMDSRLTRRALIFLEIQPSARSLISGQWRYWKPGLDGPCLNFHIPEAGNRAVGAGLIRDQQGVFKLSVTLNVKPVISLADFFDYIKAFLEVAKRHGIFVTSVQSSHSQMIQADCETGRYPLQVSILARNLFNRYGVRRMKRIPSLLNQAAICLAYNTPLIGEETTLLHLPKPVVLSIQSDMKNIRVFCDKENDEQQTSTSLLGVHDDLSLVRPSVIRPRFIDDTNVS